VKIFGKDCLFGGRSCSPGLNHFELGGNLELVLPLRKFSCSVQDSSKNK
jgi:hypothetical protein